MRLVWTPLALSDRDNIFTHIEDDDPRAAVHVDERIAIAVRRLVDFTESGRPGRIAGTRELVIPRTPYVAAYIATPDTIRILRVLHGAQMWPDELARGGRRLLACPSRRYRRQPSPQGWIPLR